MIGGLKIDSHWLKLFSYVMINKRTFHLLMTSWSIFRIVCLFHAFIDIFTGLFMVFSITSLSRVIHGDELIQTSESLVGMMLICIGILLSMISHLEQLDFQRYLSKGCILIHLLLATWRIFVESQVQVLQKDVRGQITTDCIFATTWMAVLAWTRDHEHRN